MLKIFSYTVAAALLYLVLQQFPQETRELSEWADNRSKALANLFSSRDRILPDNSASSLRAGVESASGGQPAKALADPAPAAMAQPEGTRHGPSAIRSSEPVDSETGVGRRDSEGNPGLPSTGRSVDRESAWPETPALDSSELVDSEPDADHREHANRFATREDSAAAVRQTARIRRDALAALAERMETMAARRAL